MLDQQYCFQVKYYLVDKLIQNVILYIAYRYLWLASDSLHQLGLMFARKTDHAESGLIVGASSWPSSIQFLPSVYQTL